MACDSLRPKKIFRLSFCEMAVTSGGRIELQKEVGGDERREVMAAADIFIKLLQYL